MNCVALIGRLTKDPELNTFANGTNYVLGSVALNITNEKVEFIPFKAIGAIADIIAKNFHKGSRIGIQGELKTQKVSDKLNSVIVEVKRVDFIDPKKIEADNYEDDYSYYANGGY